MAQVKNVSGDIIGDRIMGARATDGTLFEIKGWEGGGMEALKPEFARKIFKKIQNDSALQRHLARNVDPRISEIDVFREKYLENIQNSVNALMGPF